MALAKPTDNGFKVIGRLRIEDPGRRPTWAHSVVFGRRLHIGYSDKLGAMMWTQVSGGGKISNLADRLQDPLDED